MEGGTIMPVRSKLLLSGLTAAVALCALTATASASRLSFSSRTFRLVWTPMKFAVGFGELTIQCNVTLEGSLHSATFVKVERSLLGYVTRASVTECPLSALTATLPWKVVYYRFSGRLPNITEINISFVGVRLRVNEFGCLAFSTEAEPMKFNMLRTERGIVSRVIAEPARGIPTEGVFCEAEVLRFAASGRESVTVQGAPTLITLTLI
jgi:hypothetical protein